MPRYGTTLIASAALLWGGATPAPAQQPPSPSATPKLAAPKPAAPVRNPQTLQEVANEIVWNPQRQGVLLLVAPEQTPVSQAWMLARFYPGVTAEEMALPRNSNEGLRLEEIGDYFDRQIVPCGDITVFAPATMTVLNDKNLPRPLASASLKPADNFRLLQASLSDAQWQQLTSSSGLGLTDLTRSDQRDWFLAALPTQIAFQRVEGENRQNGTVSDAQRQSIRVHLARRLDWGFPMEEGGTVGVSDSGWGDDTPRLWLTDMQERNPNKPRPQQLFGVDLVSKVPAHTKPGDLVYTWDALNVPVALEGAKTLGDIVDRVRAATHVEVYADPRYAGLPVTLRGDSARASNLLKAVARGVAGTYRKVGDAYVLTDDVTGLAVRHARLQEWINASSRLASSQEQAIRKALTHKEFNQMAAYDDNDPFKPSDALKKRYDAYQAELRAPRKPGDPPPNFNRIFALSVLPPKVQDIARRQIEYLQKTNKEKLLSTNAVSLSESVELRWDIPGVGVAKATYDGAIPSNEDAQNDTSSQPATPLPLLQTVKTRAVIVRLDKPDGIVPAAKRAGFSELWAEVDPDRASDRDALAQVLQEAKQAGLAVRALVCGGRRKADQSIPRSARDVNVFGETYTEYLARVTGGKAASAVALADEDLAESRLQQERGDWLAPETPEWQQTIEASVRALSKTPGIAGVVVSDLTPQGYGVPHDINFNNIKAPKSPGDEQGYREARRLEFLRRFHADPLDLTDTIQVNPLRLRYRQRSYSDFTLPFFPDDFVAGADPKATPQDPISSSVETMRKRWIYLRADLANTSLTRLQKSLAGNPVPVWFYRNNPDLLSMFNAPYLVESRDKGEVENGTNADVLELIVQKDAVSSNPFKPTAGQRARSSTVLMAVDTGTLARLSARDGKPDEWNGLTGLLFDPAYTPIKNYDGFVMDLTGESPSHAIARLAALTPTGTPANLPASKTP